MMIENLGKDEDDKKVEHVIKVEDDNLQSVEYDTIDLVKDQLIVYDQGTKLICIYTDILI